ncbi:MAG: hypothetical protein HQL26_03555 [Candidatus Omnitrophica bacterium]|nr:hypothetical protein [Candidatus Omnitrophota bacterium]
MDEHNYLLQQKQQAEQWEAICKNCGACCGLAEHDPCENLRPSKTERGKYFCSDYTNRFGPHKTIHGKSFICVPIRDILNEFWPGDRKCAYKKNKDNTGFKK